MESNSNDSFDSQNGSTGGMTGSQAGSQGNGGSMSGGTGTAGSGTAGSSTSGMSRENASETAGNMADKAKSAASTAGDKLADVGSSVRDRAGNLKSTLADALESGAERLRQQGSGGGQIAGANATGESTGMIADTPQLGAAANQLAGGMQASADWLRDADIDGLKAGVERQVQDHPGRTLAVAVGLGYLLGKAFRR